MKYTKTTHIATDILLIIFTAGQLLVIAYFTLRTHTDTCSGPGFADGCTSGSTNIVAAILGVIYATMLLAALVKSASSLHKTLRKN